MKIIIRRCEGNPDYWCVDSNLYTPDSTDADLGRLIAKQVALHGAASVELVLSDESEARAAAALRDARLTVLDYERRKLQARAKEINRQVAELTAMPRQTP